MENNSRYEISPKTLMEAIQGEHDAIIFYEQLQKMAPDKQCRELIDGIRDDEKKHFAAFSEEYVRLTGKKPHPICPSQPYIATFMSGVKKSIMDELDAYEFYRNVFLANPTKKARDIFLEALTDENEHAAKHNYMYTKVLEDKLI